MIRVKAFLLPLLTVTSLLSSIGVVMGQSNSDSHSLKDLINRHFEAFQQEDLQALMSYWSVNSPRYETEKQRAEAIFAGYENIRASVVDLSNWEVSSDKASVHLRFEMSFVDSNSKEQVKDGSLWLIQFVRENGTWKFWDKISFARVLADTKSKEQRARLMQERRDLLTSSLVEALGDWAAEKAKEGDHGEALRMSEVAAEAAQASGDKSALSTYHMGRGRLFQLLGRYDDALKSLEAALRLAREVGDAGAEVVILGNTATVYSNMGRAEEAVKQTEAIREVFRAAGKRRQEAIALANLGGDYHSLGNHKKALEAYEESLTISRLPSIQDKEGEAIALNGIALVYTSTGRFDEALAKYEESLRVSRASNIQSEEIAALNNMGTLHAKRGELREALEKFETARDFYRKHKSKVDEARARGGIAEVYARQGRYAEALRIYNEILQVFHQAPAREEEAATLVDMAGVYFYVGSHDDALRSLRNGLTIHKELKNIDGQLVALNNLGNVYSAIESYDEAVKAFDESLRIATSPHDRAITLNNLGEIYEKKREYGKALGFYEDSLKIKRSLNNRLGESVTLNNMAVIHDSTGRPEDALNTLKRALELAEPLDDVYGTFPIYANIGDVHFRRRKWEDAASALRKATERIEKIRGQTVAPSLKTTFFAQYISPYHNLVKSYLELGLKEEALAFSEQVKSRTLLDMTEGGRFRLRNALSPSERKEDSRLQDRISFSAEQLVKARRAGDDALVKQYESELSQARDAYDLFQATAMIRHDRSGGTTISLKPLTLAEIARGLPREPYDASILSFQVGRDETLLFVLARRRNAPGALNLKVHVLKDENGGALGADEVAALVGRFNLHVGTDGAPYKALSSKLYRLLIAPAEKDAEGAGHLIIVPDGALTKLPFQALLDGDAKFLIQKFRLSYAPSIKALITSTGIGQKRRKTGRWETTMLAAGRGTFTDVEGYRDRPLPWAPAQARAVANIFKVPALTDADATEEAVKKRAERTRYLHFATHAELSVDAPLYSAIILGKSEGEDGLLYARELSEMNLTAELVTLAACETGLGRHVYGEGLMGPAWALLAAGTPSAVVTQWKVQDVSSNRFMSTFYGRLGPTRKGRSGARSKAAALQAAQISFINSGGEYAHPYHWAPYILVGDWQ